MHEAQGRKDQIQHKAIPGYKNIRTLVVLHNRYQALEIETPSKVEEVWKSLKNMWKDACEEVVGRRRTDCKSWLSRDTESKVCERRNKKEAGNRSKAMATKAAAQKEYAAANKEVKRSVKRDKRKFIEDLTQQTEEAAGKNNLKDLYQTTRKLTGKFRHTQAHIKNSQGVLLTTKEDQVKTWTEHFRDLLNRQPLQLNNRYPISYKTVGHKPQPPHQGRNQKSH